MGCERSDLSWVLANLPCRDLVLPAILSPCEETQGINPAWVKVWQGMMTPAEPSTHNGSSHALDCQQWFGIPKASATPEAGLTETSAWRGTSPERSQQKNRFLQKVFLLSCAYPRNSCLSCKHPSPSKFLAFAASCWKGFRARSGPHEKHPHFNHCWICSLSHVSLNLKKLWDTQGNKSFLCLTRKVVNSSSLEVSKATWGSE